MPIPSLSGFTRQGVTKALTHGGYAQSVVAVTHPVQYPTHHHRHPFNRRASRPGKLGFLPLQNAFHSSTSVPTFTAQERGQEKPEKQEKATTRDSGLDAYFEAWKKQHAAGEAEKEWTQFQFAKRIEWKPISVVPELNTQQFEEAGDVSQTFHRRLVRSKSSSALDDLAKAEASVVQDASPELLAEDSNTTIAQITEAQVPEAPVAPIQTPALGPAFEFSPRSGTPANASTVSTQSQTYADHLTKLAGAGRYAEIPAVFESMLVGGIHPTATAYNALLNAAIHLPTEKIQVVPKALDVYSDMLKRKVLPDTQTYDTLLDLIASRSIEISSEKRSLEERRVRYGGMTEVGRFMLASNELEYEILSEDDRLDFAIRLFDSSIAVNRRRFFSAETYRKLIAACAKSLRVPDMKRLYRHMVENQVVPMASTFPAMIQTFARSRDLVGAVEHYNNYKALAVSHDEGYVEIAERQDAVVYAALVKAYVKSDKLAGAETFYTKVMEAYGQANPEYRDEMISQGFVDGLLDQGMHPEALGWADNLESPTKIKAMSKIATVSADRGDRHTAVEAFTTLPTGDASVITPAMALMALSVREGDVAAATHFWHILSSANATVSAEFIEPTCMYAVALIGSGQVAEGLQQSEQMFARIRASAVANKTSLNDEVDEGVDFIAQFMGERGIIDSRHVEVAPAYQESYTPVQYAGSVAPSAFEDTFDPYAASTDFKGSSIIAEELEKGNNGRVKVSRLNDALQRFRNIRRAGRHPRYITYAKLISAAAREDRMNLVKEILGTARTDVPLLLQYPVVRYGWVSILDAMVGACLTLGDRQLAARYHQELLDMGAAPTANTFGLYITTLKESTKTFDEATEAVKIFHRAKAEGVEPSSFLYNALIGKLGKARRIDDCLFYFAEMRALNIRPTSVTYGTIVNALCRVSDEKFAEQLFEEMESMPNYKARPAPYNSLMQFFLTTKRDKSKVLAYYERMKSKGIEPTSHTYKLLIDTHATLEPVNLPAAEAVLDLIRSTGDKPEAVHYSSLIHAKGCVLHDLAGARAIFDSIRADRSIRLQACLYQAMFESMVANHQFSDTDAILQDMSARRVEMTPYIANTLIHGWANEKNIEKSRGVYETIGRDKREPSTYEAMTRAYLAVEDRSSAKRVVQEMLSRGYPAAVSGKIMELVGGGNTGLY
jgi:pentatricopeptide repeat protein